MAPLITKIACLSMNLANLGGIRPAKLTMNAARIDGLKRQRKIHLFKCTFKSYFT